MLRYMERSTIYYLKQKGWTNVQIAEFTGHHRDTVARVLREEVEKQPKTRHRSSAVAVFDAQIAEWLEKKLPVSRMLELARADGEHPYSGGETAFYDYIRGAMQYTQTQLTYNTDCCGLSVQYFRFAVGTRNESQVRVSFAVSNIGAFGTLKRQERIF